MPVLRRLCNVHIVYAILITVTSLTILGITYNFGRNTGRNEVMMQVLRDKNNAQPEMSNVDLLGNLRQLVVQQITESSRAALKHEEKRTKNEEKGTAKKAKDTDEGIVVKGTKQESVTVWQQPYKYPSEIIDVNAEYPNGPPDITWPEDVEIKLPKFDSSKPVPNILHYAWYGGPKRGNLFKEHHYISMLSGFKRLKPKRILFWHDERPTGDLWNKIRNTTKQVLQMVKRAPPRSIFDRPIAVPEHHSDIVRLEAIMYYGGVYTDLDVIVLKDFAPLYNYNTTMGYEVDYGLCNGIIVSKPAAPFLLIWYDRYHTFRDNEWSQHSVILPATLAKQNPKLIHTEATSMHKPYWGELDKIYGKKYFDWSNNYSIHLWIRLHGKEHSIEELKKMDNTYGRISRYTLFDSEKIVS